MASSWRSVTAVRARQHPVYGPSSGYAVCPEVDRGTACGGWALRNGAKAFAAYLSTVSAYEIEDLRLGKKATAAFEQAEELHRAIDRYAYGPPTIRFPRASSIRPAPRAC